MIFEKYYFVFDVTEFKALISSSYCAENSAAILPLLLPDETSDQVNMAASQIANRIAQEKILTWINAHITLSKIILKFWHIHVKTLYTKKISL